MLLRYDGMNAGFRQLAVDGAEFPNRAFATSNFYFFYFFCFLFFFFFSGLLERQSRQHIKFSDHPTLNHTFSALDRIDDGA